MQKKLNLPFWDESLLSDSDVEHMDEGGQENRLSILADLEGEFQGFAFGSGFYAALIPILITLAFVFDWTPESHRLWVLFGSAILFVGCVSICLFSIYWRSRFRHRIAAINSNWL